MHYLLIMNFIKAMTNSLTKQSQKNLITAVLTGIATLLSFVIGITCAPLLAGVPIYLTVSLVAAVLVPASILTAHWVWDRIRIGWLHSDDFIRQKKFLADRYYSDLKMLETLPVSDADKMKESKKIYRDYQERSKTLEANYLMTVSIHSLLE